MHASKALIDPLNHPGSEAGLDLVLLYPGAIEGGPEQIIIDLVPQVIAHPQVHAWAFERTAEPAPMVSLLLDVEASALPDIVDLCEDILSSQLTDNAGLVMRSLIDIPRDKLGEQLPWGVRQSRIEQAGGADRLRKNMAQEQAVSEVVLAVVRNVRAEGWDRKTIAPTVLMELLQRVVGPKRVATDSYRIMQHLLSGHPASETLTRQFRLNAHKLVKAEVPIQLRGAAHQALHGELDAPMSIWHATADTSDTATDITKVAAIWRRMAAGLGFTTVEAAYLACLLASDGEPKQ